MTFSRVAALCVVMALSVNGYPAPVVFSGEYQENMQGHFQFGHEMGKRFASEIKKRLSTETGLHKVQNWVESAHQGEEVYNTFLHNHQKQYPEYVEELRGVSEGAGVPFETIFMMNLIQEFELYAPSNGSRAVDQCSDYIVHNSQDVFVVHNEDSGTSDLEHVFLANVSFGARRWVSLVYMGDLPTGAFGFVPGKIAFTLNKVPPSEGYTQGCGRGFVSRDLLTAQTFDEAVRIITTPMIAGHNYQLMDLTAKRTVNIETYHTQHKVKEVAVGDAPHFHANTYILGDWPQFTDWGSIARMVRASQMPPPTDLRSALAVLGDQYNASYPVFHGPPGSRNGDITGLYTLVTARFDLNAKTLTLYTNDPKQLDKVYTAYLM